MVINVSVQYNGEFLPKLYCRPYVITLGNSFNTMYLVEVFVLTANSVSPPKPFDYSGGLAAFRFFFKKKSISALLQSSWE